MSIFTWKRLVGVLAVLLVLAGGYYAWMMMPGGALTGTTAVAPMDWGGTPVPNVVELETNPAKPYSVKIWVVPLGANLYVHAGTNRAQWVVYLENDDAARMLMDERLYDLSATRVTDAAEFAAFSDAYQIRYGRRPRNEDVNEAYLFRLSPRDGELEVN